MFKTLTSACGILAISFLFVFSTPAISQTNITAGYVSGIWTKEYSPYNIYGNIEVHQDSILTIQPGVELCFKGVYGLRVHGNLNALGTQNDSISFSADSSLYGWLGIYLLGEHPDSSLFEYCRMEDFRRGGSLTPKANGVFSVLDRKNTRISNCLIRDNLGLEGGGGIVTNNAKISISDNKIVSNQGVGITCSATEAEIIGNVLRNNTFYYGSGCGGIKIINYSTAEIKNNEISSNGLTVTESGGILISQSKADICSNRIFKNEAKKGAGIFLKRDSEADIKNCIITQNLAYSGTVGYGGGGIKVESSKARIINCTVADNVNIGVLCQASEVSAINTIFSNNLYYDEVYNFHLDDDHYSTDTSIAIIRNCLLKEGLSTLTKDYRESGVYSEISDCIEGNPSFLSVSQNYYYIDYDSDAIDKGAADTTGLGLPPNDVYGGKRVHNGQIDLGAVEYNPDENRAPKFLSSTDFIVEPGDTIFAHFEFDDPNIHDAHTAEVRSNNTSIHIENLHVRNDTVYFSIIHKNHEEDSAMISLKISDNVEKKSGSDSIRFNISYQRRIELDFHIINKNVVWGTDTVIVNGELRVDRGATLEILPGTVILFNLYRAYVNGRILAMGTPSDSIIFTLNPDSEYGYWSGLYIGDFENHKLPQRSELHYTVIEHAEKGLVIKDTDLVLLSNSTIRHNKWGVYANGGGTIEYCNIHDNNSSYNGAGIFYSSRDFFLGIYNNRIHHNTCNDMGGGIFLTNGSSQVFGNLIFANNAASGGGIAIDESEVSIVNNTIANNHAVQGGGIYSNTDPWSEDQCKIINCIIQYNTAEEYGSELFYNSNAYGNRIYNSCIPVDLESIVMEGFEFEGYTKKIFRGQPEFFDTLNHNYSLMPSSICINAGLLDPELMFSMDSTAKKYMNFQNGIPDIGAIEFKGAPDNRLPILEAQEPFYIMQNRKSQISIPYTELDRNDEISISVVSGSTELICTETAIFSDSVLLSLEPIAGFSGETWIELIVFDKTNKVAVSNRDTLSIIVSNEIDVCGTIYENTLWDAERIKVNCNITVHKDAILTIAPGTIVDFSPGTILEVFGILKAMGAREDSIKFTSSQNSWSGLRINSFKSSGPSGIDTSYLAYCVIEKSDMHGLRILGDRVKLNNSTIRHNNTGIYISSNGEGVVIENNVIRYNAGAKTGGVEINFGSPLLVNNIIEYNTMENPRVAAQNGGGIRIISGSSRIIGNHIRNNSGGGIFLREEGYPEIINNYIYNNQPSGNYGGSGLIIYSGRANARVIGNLIYGNHSAEPGGGIALYYSNAVLYNNTVVNNSCESDDNMGGGIYFHDYSLSWVNNCIVWNNKLGNEIVDLYYNTGYADPPLSNVVVTDTSNSVILKHGGIINGLLDKDPLFENPDAYNFSLSSGSPYIDAGIIDSTRVTMIERDIVGNPRINNNQIDIGAFEYQVEELTGIKMYTENGITSISDRGDSLQLYVEAIPEGAIVNHLAWELESDSTHAILTQSGLLKAIDSLSGNGIVTVRVSAVQAPAFSDEIQIDIRNQGKSAFVPEIPGLSYRIYPNPADHELITVETMGVEYKSFDLLLYDYSGKVVMQKRLHERKTKIDLSERPGIYLLIISNEGRSIWTEKVVVL